jgi:MFS family permease
MTSRDTGPLWRVRPADLRKLRSGQTVSMFGDEVTSVALPTVALLTVHATPLQFGLLTASTYLPYPFLGLQAGAWIDRMRRRRVMVMADLARFAAIASIPVAMFAGALTIAQLFAVGLVVGTASVFFNAAYQAYLPSVVGKDQITTANAKLSVSETSAQVGGPPLAGFLISFFGVAGALLLDAVSFVASVVSLTFIRRAEEDPAAVRVGAARPEPVRRARRRLRRRGETGEHSLRREVWEGLQVVFTNPLLRGLTLTSALSNLGRGMCLELFLLFAYNGLSLTPAVASLVLAVGNVGSLLGSLTCERVTKTLGIGPSLRLGSLLKGLPWVAAPLTLIVAPVPISMAMVLLSSYFVPISNVTNVSIRQSLVSRELQGRVASTTRTITRTVVPVSAVVGGVLAQVGSAVLGQRAGLAAVLVLGGLLWMSATVLLPRRRLERLRTVSDLQRTALDGADERTALDGADERTARDGADERTARAQRRPLPAPRPLPSPYRHPALWLAPYVVDDAPPAGRFEDAPAEAPSRYAPQPRRPAPTASGQLPAGGSP